MLLIRYLRRASSLKTYHKTLTSLSTLTTTQPTKFYHPQQKFTTLHHQHSSTLSHYQQYLPARYHPKLTNTTNNMLNTKLKFYNSTQHHSNDKTFDLLAK